MSEPDSSWQLFMAYYDPLTKVMRELGRRDWYVDGNYAMFIGYYHAGIYAQVYKAHWYNHTLDGIHYELGFDAESVENKSVRFDLHVGHRNLFDREAFNEVTVPRMAEIVESWEGDVKFSARNLSERLSYHRRFRKSKFHVDIADGFEQLAALSAIIDDGLREIGA